jgi:hypothetical protein
MFGKGWLFATVPAFIAAAVLLAKVIARLVRVVRASRLVAVPLAPETRVHLDATGRLELAVEGRRFSRDFAGVNFSLSRADTGTEVPLSRVLLPTEVSGFSRVRLSLYGFQCPEPADYVLRADGLRDPSPDSAVVFVRPLGPKFVLYVLGLIVLGAILIGSVVLSALTFQPPDAGRAALPRDAVPARQAERENPAAAVRCGRSDRAAVIVVRRQHIRHRAVGAGGFQRQHQMRTDDLAVAQHLFSPGTGGAAVGRRRPSTEAAATLLAAASSSRSVRARWTDGGLFTRMRMRTAPRLSQPQRRQHRRISPRPARVRVLPPRSGGAGMSEQGPGWPRRPAERACRLARWCNDHPR